MASRCHPNDMARMRRELLVWYDRSKRDLPWRKTSDPYAIWISEVMLQQTRVAAVIERYKAFLERFPDARALAEADEQDVLALWSGLGYYRRARMMRRAAKLVMAERDGMMPRTAEELRKLPGIGAYTASAIASIAYGECTAVVDGNVERVLSRIRGWESHDAVGEAAVRRKVEEMAARLIDPARPGDYNQALMELGATVCTPRSPQCLVCPWAGECRTLGEHKTPKRTPMKSKAIACVLVLRKGKNGTEVLLEQRAAANTVMPGLWELPAILGSVADSRQLRFTVRHAIMQVNYTVEVYSALAEDMGAAIEGTDGQRRWVSVEQAARMALTGLARKVLTKAGLIGHSRPAKRMPFAAQPGREACERGGE